LYFTSSLKIFIKVQLIKSLFLIFMNKSPKKGLHLCAPLLIFLCLGLSGPCLADPHEDVLKLLKQNLTDQAFDLVTVYLKDHPQDPQMRFWQGNLWVKKGERALASEVFLRLTQDYPELSEPHNNLGILQFEAGDYQKAKNSFETALKLQPNYALAMENLADTYLLLSKSSMEQALVMDPKSKSAHNKLELINQLLLDWAQKKR
jgi:tetratricopeptide (TPR) repeat protein